MAYQAPCGIGDGWHTRIIRRPLALAAVAYAVVLFAAALGSVACSGAIDDNPPGDRPSAGETEIPAPGAPPAPQRGPAPSGTQAKTDAPPWQDPALALASLPAWSIFPEGAAKPIPARFDRLRQPHLESALQRAFGATFKLDGLPDDPYAHRSHSLSAGLVVSQFFIREYLDRVLAAIPAWSSRRSACAAGTSKGICATEAAEAFWNETRGGTLPLSIAESLGNAILRAEGKAASYDDMVTTAVLLTAAHPAFLFVIDRTIDKDPFKNRAFVDRLSMLMWNEPASDPAIAMFANRDMNDEGQRKKAVEFFSASPKSKRGIYRFFEEVMGVSQLDDTAKEPAQFPFFNAAFKAQVLADFRSHIVASYENKALPLSNLLMSSVNTFGSATAAAYTLKAGADPKFERAGLLAHPASVIAFGEIQSRNLVKRGKQILQTFFCFEPPSPPPELDVKPPVPAKTGQPLNFRQQVERHSQNPTCNACHRFLDPGGFAMEAFDPVGRAVTYMASALDTSGRLELPGLTPLPFKNAKELARSLAEQTTVRRCFVRHAFRLGMGQVEDRGDGPHLLVLSQAFDESKGDAGVLLSKLASSTFFYKRGE